MGKYEDFYQKLRQKHSDEEIADAHVISADLTEEELELSNLQFREMRLKMLREMTEEDKMEAEIMSLRFQIEDSLSEPYSETNNFGNYFKEYIRATRKAKKEIAIDLDLHYTKLSRLLNDKEDPNIALTYRLQEHSGDLIAAVLWWKLLVKKQEYELKNNQEKRQVEVAKVRNALKRSA